MFPKDFKLGIITNLILIYINTNRKQYTSLELELPGVPQVAEAEAPYYT